MFSNPKTPVIASLILLSLGIISSWIFTLFAILNDWPINLEIFFSLFGALLALNLFFLLLFYKKHSYFSLEKQIAAITWGSASIWYWLFAPIYFVLNLNFNQLQLKFAAFEFAWEVPALGLIFILISVFSFKPINNFLEKKGVADKDKLYRATLRYPQFIAILIFLITILGYVLGGLQSKIFAHLPNIEYIKTVWEGIVISLFLSTTLYLFFDLFLEKIRGQIEKEFKLKDTEKRTITLRIFGVATAVIVGGFGLISLSVFQSSQSLIADNIIAHFKDVLPQVKYAISKARNAEEYNNSLGGLLMGKNATIFYIDTVSVIKNLDFSSETKSFIENTKEGFTKDFKNEIKIISVFQDPTTLHKIVTSVLQTDFYGPLINLSKFFIISIFFILALSIGTLTLMSLLLSRSIKKLTQAINLARNTATPYVPPEIYTADEIESLSQAFSHYIQESRGLHGALQTKIIDLENAKNKIAEEKSQDEAMLKSIGEGLIATDRKGNVTTMNPHALALLGLTNEEVVGQHFSKLWNIETEENKEIDTLKNPIQLALSLGQKSYNNTLLYVARNKNKIPVAVTVSPIMMAETIIGAICVFRDITKEKEVEKLKNEFVILASHQLRTPLSTIKWYAETILHRFSKNITKGHKEYLTAIYVATTRMVELVNALLNVSRIDLGTFPIEPQMIDLEKHIHGIISNFSEDLKLKEIKLQENFSQNLGEIKIDPKILNIILQNLLSNAIKYSHPNSVIEITLEKKDGIIALEVKDSGYGIPEKDQKRIFTKLFRADNIKDKEPDGTGLGLYIVKSVVDTHKGKIWFESIENKGTTFYVTIPLTN